MRRHYLCMMAAKLGAQVFGHGVRPLASAGPRTGVRGDRIGATTRSRAP
jgi:hypothetical protein